MGGVNNITTKTKRSKEISYDWERGDSLQNHLVTILNRADVFLKKNYPASKIVFCPLIGSDLSRVVTSGTASEADQTDVDNAVWEFNTNIYRINDKRNTKCHLSSTKCTDSVTGKEGRTTTTCVTASISHIF